MSVTIAAAAAGKGPESMGFGSNLFSRPGSGGVLGAAMRRAMRQKRAAAASKARAVGSATSAVGGDNGRLDSIESRITALEGGGESNSVTGAAGVKTGGEGFQDMATVTSGTTPEIKTAGSLQEAMPGPAGASMDIFGSEFARNSAVGAAKMIKNKNL
jgi:hypothetical protein